MGLDGICFERIWWDEMDLEGPMSQLDRNWNDMQNGGRNQRCGLGLGAATRCASASPWPKFASPWPQASTPWSHGSAPQPQSFRTPRR